MKRRHNEDIYILKNKIYALEAYISEKVVNYLTTNNHSL